MARRRKHTKKAHHRRRKTMSGIATGSTNVVAMLAGAVIGKVISSKLSDKVNPKILAGGQIALGYALPKFVKNKFVAGVGTGMIINGGLSALSSFGVISAISGLGDGVSVDFMSGTDELKSIAGDYDGEMGLIDEGTMSGTADLNILAGSAYDMDDMGEDSDF